MNLARAVMLSLLVCSGCAHLPDATMRYYLPHTTVAFKVQRSVTCDALNNVIAVNTVTPAVTHAADLSAAYPVPYKPLNSVFADSDVKFDFYDDGRLKGVNATLTGQGESILKTVVSIAATLGQLGIMGFDQAQAENVCAWIKSIAGDKALVLGFGGVIDLASRAPQFLEPDAQSDLYGEQLAPVIGPVCATVLDVKRPEAPFAVAKLDGVGLRVRQPGWVEIALKTGPVDGSSGCGDLEIWHDKVQVAQEGIDYDLPMPKAPMFGKQTFVAAFAESGALMSVQYVSNTGAGQALNVVDTALTTAQGLTAKRAAELNAEADLIVAQQRIAACRADPANCK